MGHQREAAVPGRGAADGWAVPGQRSVGMFAPGGHVVDEARSVFDRFAAEAASLPAGEQLVAMRQVIDQLEGLWLAASADLAGSGELAQAGHASLASWMRHSCRMAPGEASARAKVATAVTTDQERTGAALRSGAVSWRHAQVIDQTLRQVPAEHRADAEQAMLQHAEKLDPGALRRVGDRLVHCFDREGAERAELRRLERRGLSVAETMDGMVSVTGLLDPVNGALLMTALGTKLRPSPDGQHGDGHASVESGEVPVDPRSWAQRRADALGELCSEWLEQVNTTVVGGVRPHLSVIVDQRTLADGRPADVEATAAELAWVGPVSDELARMIGCDSTVSRVVMDGPSQVIDVGRATRTIGPGLRRAVAARDRHCVGPGCHRPPETCDVHHVIFWEHGGQTTLENTVLLCRHHHRLVHLKHWRVVIDTTGRRTLTPPT